MKLWGKNMSSLEKRSRNCIAGEALVAILGAFMLFSPELALKVCVYVFALALCAIGITRIIKYFKSDVKDGIMGMNLALGLAVFFGGVVLFVFPMIPTYAMLFILGGVLVAGGFAKIQMAMDAKRMNNPRWWVVLLLASASLIMGLIALINPFSLATAIVSVIGAFLIVESVIDIYSVIDFKRIVGDLFNEQ